MSDRIKQIESMIEADPSDPFLPYALALERAKHGRHSEALTAFDACLELDPSYAYAYFHKARSLVELDRIVDAILTLESGSSEARKIGDAKATSELDAFLEELRG